MGDFVSAAAGPSVQLSAEWHAAINAIEERLLSEITAYKHWQEETLSSLRSLKDRLEDDLDGKNQDEVSSLLNCIDLCDQAISACQTLVEGRVEDVKVLIARAQDVNAFLVAAFSEHPPEEVVPGIESSEEFRALTDIPDRNPEVFRLDELTESLAHALLPVVESEAESSVSQEDIWMLSSLNIGSDRMYSTLLWDLIYDGEMRRLLPGLAGEAVRQQA